MQFKLNPKRILVILLVVMGILLVAHTVSAFIRWNFPIGDGFALSLALDVDQEISLPTWFSQTCLLLAGAAALIVGLARRANKLPAHRYWYGIAALLTVMSADEGSSLHELVAAPLGRQLETEGTWLFFAWVLVGLALVAIVAVIYLRFWWRLPVKTRVLVALAAVLYVGGAIGLEILGGYRMTTVGDVDVVYMILAGIEETLEMLGAIVAVYAFLDYLKQSVNHSNIHIK